MALTYTGSSGIFTHVGKLIARINSYGSIASSTLGADLTTLVTAFGTIWLPPEGVASSYAGLQESVTGWRQSVARFVDTRLLDPVTVLTQLSSQLSTSAGMGDLLPALIRQMQLDSQTVKASTCTASTASALASNAGNGSAYPTLTLDGFNPPLVGSISSLSYVGKQSQLCVPAETMTLECVADSPNDGLTAGDEVWGWSGGSAFPQLCWQTEGSGVGPSIRTDNGTANILSNGGFTSWSGSLPLGWTLDSGTLGASLIQAGVEAQFVGGYPVVQISQALSSSQLTASRRYHISVMARASGVTSGTLGLTFSGGSGLSVPLTSLGATAAPQRFHATTIAPIPVGSSLALNINGLNAGGNVWLSLASVAPTTYHGGVAVNVIAGSTPWQRGDRLTFTTSNDQAGKFQDFFRRRYGVQLPSVLSGSPQGYFLGLLFTLMTSTPSETISDSLVV